MSVIRKLRGFDFTAIEYASDPEGVLERAKTHAGASTPEAIQEIERYIRCRYTGKKAESVRWEPMAESLRDGGRLTGWIGPQAVSGTVTLSPKSMEVRMDLPRKGVSRGMTLQMLAPVIFTEEPCEGSPANEYGQDVARRLLLDGYYSTLAKND